MSISQRIRNWLSSAVPWALALACVLIMLKSTNDPGLTAFSGSWIESSLQQIPTGNQIAFDVSVGILVSQFMYVLVVWLPERRKRRRVRINLERQYDVLKEECITYFLFACKEAAEYDHIQELKGRNKFKDFFNQSVNEDQSRWHAVLNGLDSEHIEGILFELEIFKVELEYALNTIDIADDATFLFLRRLTRALHRSRKWSDEYDQLKPLSQFMWSIFTGWDQVEGYTDRDRVAEMIKSI